MIDDDDDDDDDDEFLLSSASLRSTKNSCISQDLVEKTRD